MLRGKGKTNKGQPSAPSDGDGIGGKVKGEQRAGKSRPASGKGRPQDWPLTADLRATIDQLAEETKQRVEGMGGEKKEEQGVDNEEGLEDADVMEKLMKQFEEMGGNQDMQGLVDTMMRQLLSKDILYEPMKEIAEKYPPWIEAKRGTLSSEDLARFEQQLRHIRRLCSVFESAPDDFPSIISVMQEMQACGQPPPEIMRELAPGLELGEDGLPMLPDLGGSGLNDCNVM